MAKSGFKEDPVQLQEIKVVRHEGSHLVFTTKEWRSSKQISRCSQDSQLFTTNEVLERTM